MKTTYTDEEIQSAIDAAFPKGKREDGFNLDTTTLRSHWESESPNRLAIAKAFLEKLEPDPYAELKKAHAEGKVIEVFVKDDEYGPDRWSKKENNSWTLPPECYRIKPESETFEAHGKTWTRHNPGDAMPCGGDAMVEVLTRRELNGAYEYSDQLAERWYWSNSDSGGDIIGWRYADEPPKPETPWTPAVGDVVQLKSGGPKMTIHFLDAKNAGCVTFSNTGEFTFATIPQTCLTLVTE